VLCFANTARWFPDAKLRFLLRGMPRSTTHGRIVASTRTVSAEECRTVMNTPATSSRDASVNDPWRASTHTEFTAPTHPVLVGYLFWLLGFIGAHRFYFGKPLTGTLWFFTGGIFLIGWIIDLFLIPQMAEEANLRFRSGRIDYTVTWVLFLFLGLFGIHRLYMGKIVTGIVYLLSGGLFGIGFVYDALTLNQQVQELNAA